MTQLAGSTHMANTTAGETAHDHRTANYVYQMAALAAALLILITAAI
jgi:hypothetical protein